jgi:hypothetical protein
MQKLLRLIRSGERQHESEEVFLREPNEVKCNIATDVFLMSDMVAVGRRSAALANALKDNTSVRCLQFRGDHYGKDNTFEMKRGFNIVNPLAGALKVDNYITSLCIDGLLFGDHGAIVTADALKVNTSLISLSLNGMRTKGVVASVVKKKSNNLDYNEMGKSGILAMP